MKTMNLILGSLAAGVALGMLLAPRKGTETRDLIAKIPGQALSSIRYKMHRVSDLFHLGKKELDSATRKVVYKTHGAVNEARSRMS